MFIDKEYPATHSMSTGWFIADKDGYVAIFDFNENGPIPCNIPESSANGVLEEDFILPDEKGIRNFNFDDNQADLIIEKLKTPSEFDEYGQYIVLIDVAQTDEFLKSALKNKYLQACYSKSKGLYLIEPYEATTQANEMIQRKIILKSKMFFFDITNDVYDEKTRSYNYVHDDLFEIFPFYLYQQPYWTAHLTERTFVPKYKFKISQFNPDDQKRVLRLPISFDEYSKLQIAEFLPSYSCGNDYVNIGNHGFDLLPLTGGKFKYISTYYLPVASLTRCYTEKPTILFIGSCYDDNSLLREDPVLCMKSGAVFPYEDNSFYEGKRCVGSHFGKMDDLFISKIKILKKDWWKCFSGFVEYWDQVFDIVNPQVVIIEDDIFENFANELNVANKKISILGIEYPYYLLSELDKRKKEIEYLTNKPYRGKQLLLILDKEDIDKWLKLQ